MHRLHYCSVALLVALLIAPIAWAQVDCLGVDGGTALPGTLCDDGNPFTEDSWSVDCECIGICYYWDMGWGYPGGACDDGNPMTENDVIGADCVCEGSWVSDCAGIFNGPNLPGTPCDDGDPLTYDDTWNWLCQCIGEMDELDCMGILNGPDMPSSPCDDGDPTTINDMWTNDCDCLAWLNTVSGRLFLDVNTNGAYDAGDHLIYNQFVRFDTTFCPQSAFIGPTGEFQWRVPEGSYQLWAWPTDDYFQDPAYLPLELIGGGGYYPNTDIAMTPLQVQTDLGAFAMAWFTVPRPGFTNIVYAAAGNSGTIPTDGTFIFTFDPQQTYLSSSPAGGVLTGNTISWDLPQLGLGQGQSFYINLETPPTIPLGTPVNYSASVISGLPDDEPLNDQVSITENVVGSYDPNDKRVEPISLTPQEIIDRKPVEYIIRFQNTGTYLAENVRIADTLSIGLDVSTLEFIASSHPLEVTLDSNLLIFDFPQIMLPDSNANEPESHGFVMFRITPNSDLQLGDAVENTAAIYFDFNEPIITDPAVFTVERSTGISDRKHDQLQIWPNPANDMLNVQLHNGAKIGLVEVVDITGRFVRSKRSSASIERMDVSDLPIGNYTIRITSAEGVFHGRFVRR